MRTPLTALLLLAVLPLLSGCAGLHPHSADSGGMRATKIATRVVIGVPTLGISEAIIGMNVRHRNRLAHVRGVAARYEDARLALQAAQTDENWERDEEWELARNRYDVAAEEVHRERARLRADARRQIAVEPFSSIHSVRRQIDERILPPVDPAPWAGIPEYLRMP